MQYENMRHQSRKIMENNKKTITDGPGQTKSQTIAQACPAVICLFRAVLIYGLILLSVIFTTHHKSNDTFIISLTEVVPSRTYSEALMRRVLMPSSSALSRMASASPLLLMMDLRAGLISMIS